LHADFFLEFTSDCVFTFNENQTIDLVSKKASNILGYSLAELRGQKIQDLVFLEESSDGRPKMIEFLPVSQSFDADLRLRCKNGQILSADSKICTAPDGSGQILIRDFSSELRLRLLANLSETLNKSLDLHERLELAARQVLCCKVDWCTVDLMDQKENLVRLCVVHKDPEKFSAAEAFRRCPALPREHSGVLAAIENKKALYVTQIDSAYIHNKWGHSPELETLLHQLGLRSYAILPLIARGHTLGAISFASATKDFTPSDFEFFKAISDRIALSGENARLYEDALKAIQEREDTLAIASHDLKNPLASISINAQLISRLANSDTVDPKALVKIQKMASAVEKISAQATALISDLLDLSKIENGKFKLDKHKTDLQVLITDSIEMLRNMASTKGVQLETSVQGPLPEIEIDFNRMSQVLSNIVGNAIKFTPADGKITIEACDSSANEITLSVKDSGPGIRQEDLPHLFDRYWQARNTQTQGTGLGLSIAKGIVEAHGGRIWVDSENGMGSVFHFTIPKPTATFSRETSLDHH
jgi:PAS domain S-box-containing protein